MNVCLHTCRCKRTTSNVFFYSCLTYFFWDKCLPLNLGQNPASPRDPPVFNSQLRTPPTFYVNAGKSNLRSSCLHGRHFTNWTIYPTSKCLLLNERNPYGKAVTYCVTPMIWYCGKAKIVETLKSSVIARDGVEHERLLGLWMMLYDTVIVETCN